MNTPHTPVRTRFAPSPTGFLHIGAIRSALFNYLYAHQHDDGSFILRLEDTDRERFVPEAEAHLIESLKWLGISPDEGVGSERGESAGTSEGEYGPYVQSERLEIYKEHAQQLVAQGSLYPCWCTPERLTALREQAQAEKRAFKYDRHCLTNPGDLSEPHVLRFKVPDHTNTSANVVSWDDLVKGHLEFNTKDIDDFVAIKSDGFPTYQFANVVDDHAMKISHVLRADEWVASTPKHLLLYKAFGWEAPKFAHLPAVTPPGGGKKLSKRHGAKSALELRDEGYLPEAIINFLALLGWNQGEGSTKEIYSLSELLEAFDLSRVQKSPAVFDVERLIWMNGMHIRQLKTNELLPRTKDFWPAAASGASEEYKMQVLELVHERLKFFSELPELTEFFFSWNVPTKDFLVDKLELDVAKEWLASVQGALKPLEFTHDELEGALRSLVDELGASTGKLFSLIRRSVTGSTVSPGLFETLAVLGKERVMERLQDSLAQL